MVAARPLSSWSGVEGRPLVIAGPCSAESEEQLEETVRRLPPGRVDYVRAGIWKPRTRPNGFEGIGEPALAWLRRVGDRHRVRVATEVATAKHVELALAHGIDLVWIGARTTVNPFSVQEVAHALRGVEIPVLVKNPTSPDLGLWIGAVERVAAAGVKSLGLIHRGFHTAGKTRYRNAPFWDLVIEMRRQVPELPMINDPSHIGGRRDLLLPIAQRAMDVGLDGVMIETHRNPDQAWSDAAQQVTPERFAEILAELHVRRQATGDGAAQGEIHALRDRIDQLDHDLLDLLAQRMRIVEQIADVKGRGNLTTLQLSRYRELLEDRMQRAKGLELGEGYVKALFEVIHEESVRRQSEIISGIDD